MIPRPRNPIFAGNSSVGGWEEEALKEKETENGDFEGKEETGVARKRVGIIGKKLEDIAMAVEDKK